MLEYKRHDLTIRIHTLHLTSCFRFVTEGYVSLLAMKMLGLTKFHDCVATEVSAMVIAKQIVDECWPIHLRGATEVLQADEKPDEDNVCICDNGRLL